MSAPLKIGDPAPPKKETRKSSIKILLYEEERALLAAAAKRAGMSLSTWIRSAAVTSARMLP